MSESENIDLIMRYYDAWGRADVEGLDALVARDFVGHDPSGGGDFDREGLKLRLAAFRQGIPDFTVKSQDTIAQGDLVVMRWRTEATHSGDLLGAPGSGRNVSFTGITIYRVANGRIAELWNEWDNLRLMQAIGAI